MGKKLIPTGEVDLLHPKLDIGWGIKASLVIVFLMAIFAISTWGYNQVKGLAVDTKEAF